MKYGVMTLLLGYVMMQSPALAALPLPDGMTPASVQADMQRSCAADAQSAACRRFSLLNYCRGNYDQAKCLKERQYYWCTSKPDQKRCAHLTAQIGGTGSSSSGSGSSTSSSGSTSSSSGGTCPEGTRRGAGGTECNAIPLCEIMHTCGGASSSTSSGSTSSSSGSSSSGSGSGSTSSSSSGSGSTSSSSGSSSSTSSSSSGGWGPDLVQGAFMGGNSIYNMLHASKARLFIDSGNPLSTSDQVHLWVDRAQGGQSMSLPRPANVRLALAGYVPRLRDFTYQQAAGNDARWRAEWVKIGEILQASGNGNAIIYSSETQKAWKKWFPKAPDIAGGENSNWKRAWRNMVNAVRSKAPNVEFAFTPFTGSGSEPDAYVRNDNSGDADMNHWYVSGMDNLGKPYMDYWGFTFYANTQGTNCLHPCVPTAAVFNENLAYKMDTNRKWSVGQQIAFARSKGLKLFNSELGLSLGRGPGDKEKARAGDYPEAIDMLKKLVEQTRGDVIAYVWFNGNLDDFDSRVDGSSPIGQRSSVRVKELFTYK